MAGVPLPQVEGVIALSVLALGLAIAAERAWPTWLAMLFVGFFALFHGHAHGAEIPSLAAPWAYVGGFLLATAFLHLTGVGIGEACQLAREPARLRALLGAAVAGIGVHILLLTYGVV
jgi:urease accessory protein